MTTLAEESAAGQLKQMPKKAKRTEAFSESKQERVTPRVISSDEVPYGVYTIQNVSSSLYAGILGLAETSDAPDVRLRESTIEDSRTIRWIVDERKEIGYNNIYVIRNVSNGKVLNVLDGSPTVGTNITTVEDGTTYDSLWIIRYLSDSRYYLQNITSGQYMAANGSTVLSNVQTADNFEGTASRWMFNTVLTMTKRPRLVEVPHYIIQGIFGSKQYLKAGSNANGSNIIWQRVQGGRPPRDDSYKFLVTKIDNFRSLYNIRCLNTDDKYLSVDGGSKANGAKIVMWDNPRSFHSRFYFDTVSTTGSNITFAIRNVNSNLFITMDVTNNEVKQYSNPTDTNVAHWRLIRVTGNN